MNHPTYERYIREISNYPRISSEREAELSRTILRSRNAAKVEQAVDEMIHANLFLVIHCLKDFEKFLSFPGIHITRMDLIAEGNIALMTAARRYSVEYVSKASGRPVKFSTYACGIIRNRMRRALKMARLIRIPEQHFAYWSKMRKMEEQYGTDLSDQFLMKKLAVGPSKLRKLKTSFESRVSMLEDMAVEDGESRWNDIIPNRDTASPGYETDRKDLNSFLRKEMGRLPPRTKRMIAMTFLSDRGASLSDLSKQFGVSRERCRQVLAKGLKVLRSRIEAQWTHVAEAESHLAPSGPAGFPALRYS